MPHDVPVEILIPLSLCYPNAAIFRRTGRDPVADYLPAGHETVGWTSDSCSPGQITKIETSSIQ